MLCPVPAAFLPGLIEAWGFISSFQSQTSQLFTSLVLLSITLSRWSAEPQDIWARRQAPITGSALPHARIGASLSLHMLLCKMEVMPISSQLPSSVGPSQSPLSPSLRST